MPLIHKLLVLFGIRKKPPIFIVGAPRSGTTWLWGILTSHPKVASMEISDFNPKKSSIKDGKRTTSETGAFLRYSQTFIKETYTKKQKQQPRKFLVEKTPHHIYKLEEIKNCFPEAKILFIERNPKSVISSMLNSKFYNFANDIDDAIEKYNSCITALNDYKNKDIIHHIKYEDLHDAPIKTVNKALNFIGLPTKHTRKMVKDNRGRSKVDIKGVFRKGTTDSYKTEFSEDELKKMDKKIIKINLSTK